MNKNTIIAIVGGLVLVVLAFVLGRSGTEPSPSDSTQVAVENDVLDDVQEVSQEDSENGSTGVYINNAELSAEQFAELKERYGVDPVAGSYWYDSRSGAFGNMGGPAIGVMYPGHSFGSLPANASNGGSGVYFNGRQLTDTEAYLIAGLFGYPAPVPGRYWMDASGNLGVEGSNIPLGNIYAAIAVRGGGSGDNIWSKGLYSGGNYYTGAGGQVTQGYVSVPGYGPVSHGF